MAPKPGADSFLASARKAASAGILLALAAALLLLALAGCGGGDSNATTGGVSSDDTGTAVPSQSAEKSRSSAQTKGASSQDPPKQAQADPQQANAAASNGEGKKGPRISQPKGSPEPAPTSQQRAESTPVSISLSSPALAPGPESISPLPATYSCNGKDTWPPLKWSGVPPGTAELALFTLNLEPVNEALFFDWALAGIDPSAEGIESGQLPQGAIVGRNSFGRNGYSICPAASKETVIFALYALPGDLGARPGFDPAALRKQILAGPSNAGLLAVSYGRE